MGTAPLLFRVGAVIAGAAALILSLAALNILLRRRLVGPTTIGPATREEAEAYARFLVAQRERVVHGTSYLLFLVAASWIVYWLARLANM
jgi:hypothetical protein